MSAFLGVAKRGAQKSAVVSIPTFFLSFGAGGVVCPCTAQPHSGCASAWLKPDRVRHCSLDTASFIFLLCFSGLLSHHLALSIFSLSLGLCLSLCLTVRLSVSVFSPLLLLPLVLRARAGFTMTLNAVYGLTQALHWTTKWDYFINLSASDLPLLRTVRTKQEKRAGERDVLLRVHTYINTTQRQGIIAF